MLQEADDKGAGFCEGGEPRGSVQAEMPPGGAVPLPVPPYHFDIKITLAVVAVFMAIGMAIYSNVLMNGIFVFDDFEYVVGNPISEDLSLVRDLTDPRQMGYLSFALNFSLGGAEPWGYHLVNVLIHITNAVMVFFLTGRIFHILRAAGGAVAASPEELPAAYDALPFLTSLIFLVHPIETQAVSYVTQRFTSLSAFFYLAAALSYLSFRMRIERDEHGPRVYLRFGVALLSTLLAMKTKEISFTVPFMMGVFEVLLFRGSVFKARRFYFLLPFLATLVIVPASLMGQEWGMTTPGQGVDEVTRRDKLFDLFQRSPFEYLITQFRVIIVYIRLMLLPVHQLAVYDMKASRSVLDPAVIGSFLALAAMVWGAVYCWRLAGSADREKAADLRMITVGTAWFFLALSIESSIIPIKDMIFEHRVYLPSIGFFMAVSVLYRRAAARVPLRLAGHTRTAVLALVLVAPLSIATYVRNEVWTDEVRFWDDIVQKTGKAIGYNNRGNAYVKNGQFELAIQDLSKTISFFPNANDRMAWENADFTVTNMAKTYISRANAYAALGDTQRANADFDMARQLMKIQPMPPPLVR